MAGAGWHQRSQWGKQGLGERGINMKHVVIVCLALAAWVALEVGVLLLAEWRWRRSQNRRGGRLQFWLRFHGGVK